MTVQTITADLHPHLIQKANGSFTGHCGEDISPTTTNLSVLALLIAGKQIKTQVMCCQDCLVVERSGFLRQPSVMLYLSACPPLSAVYIGVHTHTHTQVDTHQSIYLK